MNNSKKHVHIIDDDEITLNEMKKILSTKIYKIFNYNSAQIFFDNFNDDGIGCLIIALQLPGTNGLELQDTINHNGIDMPVIMLTKNGNVPDAVRAMKAGAIDFIEKPIDHQLLLNRVNNALEKHQHLREQALVENEVLDCVKSLTTREHEVMDLVVAGLQNKDIAKHLGISVKTVEVHRANTMEKMKVDSIAHLVCKSLLIK